MIARISIANVTTHQLASYLADRGVAGSVFPHVGFHPDWGMEDGATAEIGVSPTRSETAEAVAKYQIPDLTMGALQWFGEKAAFVNIDGEPFLLYHDGRREDV